MARSAWVWNFVFVGHSRADELKCVCVYLDVRNSHLNFRHVTSHTFTPSTACFVVRMFFQSACSWSIESTWGVTIQGDHVRGLAEFSVVTSAMCVVASKTGD